MRRFLVAVVTILLLVGCSGGERSYYKEMSAINQEFKEIQAFMRAAIDDKESTDLGDRMEYAGVELRRLAREVESITPPDAVKEEHIYYQDLMYALARAFNVNSDEATTDAGYADAKRLRVLVLPLTDRLEDK